MGAGEIVSGDVDVCKAADGLHPAGDATNAFDAMPFASLNKSGVKPAGQVDGENPGEGAAADDQWDADPATASPIQPRIETGDCKN